MKKDVKSGRYRKKTWTEEGLGSRRREREGLCKFVSERIANIVRE